jgi:hypothetical protein
VLRHHVFGGEDHSARKGYTGLRSDRRWISSAVLAGIAIAVACCCLSASAATPSTESPGTNGLGELTNSNSEAARSERWKTHPEGWYAEQQIVGDAELARQLIDNAKAANDETLDGASPRVKTHHLHSATIVLLAIGGFLLFSIAVLLVWSRIVHYREMRDAPPPSPFNYPGA